MLRYLEERVESTTISSSFHYLMCRFYTQCLNARNIVTLCSDKLRCKRNHTIKGSNSCSQSGLLAILPVIVQAAESIRSTLKSTQVCCNMKVRNLINDINRVWLDYHLLTLSQHEKEERQENERERAYSRLSNGEVTHTDIIIITTL